MLISMVVSSVGLALDFNPCSNDTGGPADAWRGALYMLIVQWSQLLWGPELISVGRKITWRCLGGVLDPDPPKEMDKDKEVACPSREQDLETGASSTLPPSRMTVIRTQSTMSEKAPPPSPAPCRQPRP